MNRWKFRRNTSRLILVLASLVTLIVIVMTGVSGYAIDPDGAYIGEIKGTGLVIGVGKSGDRKPASKKDELRPNTILYVPGNRSWANLGFFEDSPKDSTGLLVQAGPSEMISEWSFPCSAKGRLTINWKKGQKRGCEEGVKLQSSSKKSGLPNNNVQASRRLLAQAEDEVTVVPTPGQSIIQTADSAAGISVNVLVGDVRVKSAKNPGGRLVKAGERYNYPQDTITPFDPNPILNSPEMQDFVNPNNWSSPDIPQRIADGFSEQLGEMRTALSQLPQRTASQSTQPQQTRNQSAQSNNWILEFPRYNVINGICDNGRPEITTLILTSSSFSGQIPWAWNDQQGYATNNGTVAGRNVQLNITPPSFAVGGFSTILNGSINEQGEFIGTTRVQNGDYCTGKSASFRLRPESLASNSSQQPPQGNGRCGEQQVSGGQAGDVRKIQLSRASGKIYIAYDMCPVPDTIIVDYEGKKLLQKTVSGKGLDQVEIQGTSTELTVEVIGNPNTNTTRWGYILSCPDDDKAPEPPSSVCSDSKEPSILDPLKDLIRNRLPIPLPF